MFGMGATELILILVIVIVIFGASRLPQLGKGIGEGIRNFKRGMKDATEPGRLDDGSNHNTPQ